VTNRRPVPHLALRHGFVDPAKVLVGETEGACAYVGPANEEVARRFVFDRRDPVQELPQIDEADVVARNDSWVVTRTR
jgi:hypothetical protein